MFTPKIIFGFLSSAIALLCCVPYVRDIYKGKTKPHVFSWFLWGVITATVFIVQKEGRSGAGSWVTAMACVASFFVAFLGFFKGEKKFLLVDWICFFGALFGIILWVFTKQPLSAVVILTLTDGVAYIPTFKKGFSKPFEETLSTWILSALQFIIALFAFDVFSFLNLFYPVALIVMNITFVTLLLIRRKILTK